MTPIPYRSVCPCILCRILHRIGLGRLLSYGHWPWDRMKGVSRP